jgi:hypothetical protein
MAVRSHLHALDTRRDPFVRAIAVYTAALGVGLTVLVILRSLEVGVFLAFVLPLFLASWLAVRFRGRIALVVAAMLVGGPGTFLLIGGLGVLFIPAAVLFLAAALRR